MKSQSRTVGRLLAPHAWVMGTALILGACAALAGCAEPLFLRYLLNLVIQARPGGMRLQAGTGVFARAWPALAGLAAVNLGQAVMQSGLGILVQRVRFAVSRQLSGGVIGHFYNAPLDFHYARGAGYLLTRVDRGVAAFGETLGLGLQTFIPNLLNLVLIVVLMLRLAPRLAAWALAPLPIFIYISVAGVRRMLGHETAIQEGWSRIYGRIAETLAAVKTVKILSAGESEVRRYYAAVEPVFARLWRMVWLSTGVEGAKNAIALSARLAVLAFGLAYVLQGRISAGTWIAVAGYAGMLFGPLAGLTSAWESLGKNWVAAGPALEFWAAPPQAGSLIADHASLPADGEPTRVEVSDAVDLWMPDAGPASAVVEWQNVGFAYASRREETPAEPEITTPHWVLRDISFRLQKDETVALVGASGAGKSTLLDLLFGLYAPTRGRILLHGSPMRAHAGVPPGLALVLQDCVLLDGTIGENLAFGCPEATPEQVRHAAQLARADEFIRQLPHGYETRVGERGACLSGGQRQRISIARALLRRPALLVLDEPTAQLDAVNERELFSTLHQLMRQRACLIVSHRPCGPLRPSRTWELANGHISEILHEPRPIESPACLDELIPA